MADVLLKGLLEIEKKIGETFGKIQAGKQMRTEIGTFVQDRLRAQVRRGKPLNDTGTFPSLKESTKIIREALAGTNTTHPTFKVNKSNLTFSGQLVDAIVFRLLGRSLIRIEVANTPRRVLKSAPGVKKDLEVKSNREVDKDLRSRGFVMYTAQGIESEDKVFKRINNIVKKFVRRAIKTNFGS